MKGIFVFTMLAACLVQSETASAQDVDPRYYAIEEIKVSTISKDVLNQNVFHKVLQKNRNRDKNRQYYPNFYGHGILPVDTDHAGKIIQSARDIVALGEEVYSLVTKGRPSTVTSYAPISVVPKVNGEPADLFDTENWREPSKTTYEIVCKNYFGMEVIRFRYSILFSSGGTYEGKGAYILGAQIVPEDVSTLWGFDFSATMKLGGLQNSGTRENPIAAATLLMETSIKTILQADLNVEAFYITGKGKVKKL